MSPKTAEQKAAQAAAERERAARRKAANDRLAALPQSTRDAVRRRAQTLEAAHTGPRMTAVAFLEQALDEQDRHVAAAQRENERVRVVAGSETGDEPPRSPKPGPREKSRPKEAGRPKPETKNPDELAGRAKRERGGRAAIKATVAVEVPEGTAYCSSCDRTLPESEFWPKNRTDKSKRRHDCRDCYNRKWQEWDAARRAAKAATA